MQTKHEQELSSQEIGTREAVILDTLSNHIALFEDLQKNQSIGELIEIRSEELGRYAPTPSDIDGETRDEFKLRMRKGFDMRAGASTRKGAKREMFEGQASVLIQDLKERYGQTQNVEPPESKYNVAIAPGNRGQNTDARFNEARNYDVETIIIPASYRPSNEKPDDEGLTESERAGNVAFSLTKDENGDLVPSKKAVTEYDYGVNAIQHANNIPESEMTRIYSYDKRVPASKNFQNHSEIAYYAGDDGILYAALSSPMVSENRYYDTLDNGKVRRMRPNTNDNMIMIDDMLWDAVDENGNRPTILLVTESIYQFQRVITESMFARKGIRVDSAFFNTEKAGLPEYYDSEYAQELLSLVLELDNSINELTLELENLQRMRGRVALSAANLGDAA